MGKNKNIRGLFTDKELLAKMIRFEWLIRFEEKRKPIYEEVIGVYRQQQRVMEVALCESSEGADLFKTWVDSGRVVPTDEPPMVKPTKLKARKPQDNGYGYYHGNDYH